MRADLTWLAGAVKMQLESGNPVCLAATGFSGNSYSSGASALSAVIM